MRGLRVLGYLFIVSSALLPSINRWEQRIRVEVRPEDIVLFLMIFVLIENSLLRRNFEWFRIDLVIVFILSFIFLGSLSTFYNIVFKNYLIDWNFYFKEMLRYLKLLSVYISFRSFTNINDQESLLKCFLFSAIISALVIFMQIPNLANINNIIYSLYSPPRYEYNISSEALASGALRGVSTFYGSNVYGAFLLMPICYSLENVFFSKLPIRKYACLLFVLLLLLAATFFTQSRSAFLGVIILFIGFEVFAFISRRGERKCSIKSKSSPIVSSFIFLILTFVFTLFLAGKFNLSRLFSTYSYKEAFQGGSMAAKYQAWEKNVEIVSKVNLVLGAGYNIELFGLWDSEYGYIFFFFGITGLLLYFIFFIGLLKSLLNRKQIYHRSLFLLLIAYLLINFTETTLLCNRVGPFLMMLLGLAFSSEAKRTSIEAGEDRK
jgi:hypothetical protein